MKKLNVIVLCVALSVSGYSRAGVPGDQYLEAMQKGIESVYKASGIQELKLAVNSLERIASAAELKWEPRYYAAFGYIMMATLEAEAAKKDAYLDQAMASIEKAKLLAPGECEVIALEGFVHMMRVTVDPASRGARFVPLAMQAFGQATALDPENPRALALRAQMEFGTARFFGSTPAEACALAATALEKFETYKSSNPLAPAWGRSMAESVAQQCK